MADVKFKVGLMGVVNWQARTTEPDSGRLTDLRSVEYRPGFVEDLRQDSSHRYRRRLPRLGQRAS